MTDEIEHSETAEKSSSSGIGCALALVIVPFLLIIFAVIIGLQVANDEVWLVPGDPNNFDPIAQYEQVRSYAGDNARLKRIEAQFVSADGTLNLNAGYEPSPRVMYDFYRITRQNNAPAGTSPQGAQWHRQIRVTVSKPFKWTFATQGAAGDGVGFDLNLGMDRDRSVEILQNPGEAIPAPICSFRDFWVRAIEYAGADTGSVATIIYDQSGYTFLIQGTEIVLRFDQACEQIT